MELKQLCLQLTLFSLLKQMSSYIVADNIEMLLSPMILSTEHIERVSVNPIPV